MSLNEQIKEAVKELSKKDSSFSVVCKVLSVTGDKCDCEPLDGSADLLEVRLQAQTATGILITPVIDSVVIVTMLNKFTGYVSMFSEVESIELNGSNYDGLVRVADLTTKLNNLENKVNSILTAFTTWVVVPADGGAALKALTTPISTQLTVTTQAEIENKTILHGNG